MSTTTEAQAVTLQIVDAREVVIDANIRTNVKLDRPFVASVKRHGVIAPVIGHPADGGRVRIEDGQRRILAAIEAERYDVPAYIVPENDNDAMRIVRQLIANEHRADLDETERVAAWRQLELEGMSVTAIARAVGEKPKRVKAGLAVAASESATKEVIEHQVTLDQALAIAEFEDDPEATKRLRRTAQYDPEQFEHEAQRLRDRRAEREEAEALIKAYAEQGFQQIDWPRYDDKATLPFRDLTKKDGTPIAEDNYLGGNGHRFAVRQAWNGIEVGHFVTDWRKWGLKKRKADGTPSLPMSDEEKAERRRVITNNRLWKSAETVRRTWLRNFLSRKTAPKNATAFVAATFIDGRGILNNAISDHHALASDLLGLPKFQWGQPNPILSHIEKQPARTTMALLAVSVAAHEAATGTHTWRRPGAEMEHYFRALAGWGYPLSDVENIVIGIEPEADTENDQEEEAPSADENSEADDSSTAAGDVTSREQKKASGEGEPPEEEGAPAEAADEASDKSEAASAGHPDEGATVTV
ncbi:hypothetical protein H490_0101640 [Leucobacter sp. UCD-THU]|uniref:ParB/RepB/Spo0J family partition protein n=1 Tax=Leucobacter sp. UCD-THU TaxID=1292023 RepID=UPI000370AF94|nr:ParB N-terminal domain-containing protein [Leucobacter sp. UCD-THU]EYT56666.1 hypothetical protein H490_0101640 [Leucobacter sp. UCD-THU]